MTLNSTFAFCSFSFYFVVVELHYALRVHLNCFQEFNYDRHLWKLSISSHF